MQGFNNFSSWSVLVQEDPEQRLKDWPKSDDTTKVFLRPIEGTKQRKTILCYNHQ
jgi:hypothetical protein